MRNLLVHKQAICDCALMCTGLWCSVCCMDMYYNVVTSVRTSDWDTDDFPIKIGLHQGSALSPYLFALVMDEVTRDIQGDIP